MSSWTGSAIGYGTRAERGHYGADRVGEEM
jgi:hypothetical protein